MMFQRFFSSRVRFVSTLALGLAASPAPAAETGFRFTSLDATGAVAWTAAPTPAIATLELANAVDGPWSPVRNVFSTQATGGLVLAPGTNQFRRLKALDVGATRAGFTNFVRSYGLLETVAGSGLGREDGVSFWEGGFEGGPATAAALSRPHFAMGDRAGNLYIADKNSHSILRVSTNGTIHTHAGTHAGGHNGDGPAAATSLHLNFPNGLWVRGDGTVYALDTDNGRVCRITTNGVMSTLFYATDGAALAGGRGLWVSDDETLAYFCAEKRVRTWTPAGGVKTVATGFDDLGTVLPDPSGGLLVCDRTAGQVFRVTLEGVKTVLAGNGASSGGGDGQLATETSLEGLRSAWPVPTGGYLLMTHEACQLWYLDTAGYVHLLLEGAGGTTHAGDGTWFYAPGEARMSEGRSVSVDHAGNIILCESDYGYIRRIRFLPMTAGD